MIPTENGYRVMLDHQEIGFTKDFFNWHIIFRGQGPTNPIGAYYCNNPTVYTMNGDIFTATTAQGSSVDLINNEGEKWGTVDPKKGEMFDLHGERLYLSDSYYYPIWQKPIGAKKNCLMGFIGPMQSQWGK